MTVQPDNNAYALLPPGGMVCAVCGGDTEVDDIAAVIETHRRAGSDFGVAVAVCRPCCIERAPTWEAFKALSARLRSTDDDVPHPAQQSTALSEIFIPRHKRRNIPRRHPAYGARLAIDPPPVSDPLTVAIGWDFVKNLPPPLVVVDPAANPANLRFDVAAGRAIHVMHSASCGPEWLFGLAQALIDYDAAHVDLTVYPRRAGANEDETLRVRPEPKT